MNTDSKNKNFFTVFIVIIFIILSYAIIKSFFDDNTNKNSFSKDGSFSFVYDKELLNGKILDEMYDETRTNKVVINKNYSKTTGDINKGKLFLKPSKIEYVFTNTADSPSYYKMTIKKQDYLTLYSLNEKENKMYFIVLGSDLKYYKVSLSINKNTDKIDTKNKEWTVYDEDTLSVYPNIYYKVIDDICNIEIDLPIVFNEEKYSEEKYEELRDKIEDAISFEKIDNYEFTYYSFDVKDIDINKNVKLLLNESKIIQYYSKNDKQNDISYTTISLLKSSDNFVTFSDIDDKDKFNKYLENNQIRNKEYDYKGIKTYLLYNDSNVSSKGIVYKSLLFVIDDHYYLLTFGVQNDVINDSSIESFITNNLSGILEIN